MYCVYNLAGFPPVRQFRFLTNHGLALLCIAEDPGVRMRDIATQVEITERAAQRIVAELIEAAYLDRERVAGATADDPHPRAGPPPGQSRSETQLPVECPAPADASAERHEMMATSLAHVSDSPHPHRVAFATEIPSKWGPGGVPERLNGAVSKTVRGLRVPRGFESHPLRCRVASR